MGNVKLASASIDENGKAHGGKAGDQTGREVKIQNYYAHKKGWIVLRPKNVIDADKIAYDAEAAAKNNKIGYDQFQRNTLYNTAKHVGFDCALVGTPCETDCSALVRVCCAYAGIDLPADFRTINEPKLLMNTGKFIKLTGAKYTKSPNYLKRGDILCTPSQGHTVIVLTNGKYAANNGDYVLVTGNSVNVRTAPNTDAKILGIAHKNDTYKYGGQTSINNWYLIEYKNQNAWISGKYSTLISN